MMTLLKINIILGSTPSKLMELNIVITTKDCVNNNVCISSKLVSSRISTHPVHLQ